MKIDNGLFAYDTTIVGKKKELDVGVRINKEEMGKAWYVRFV